MTDRAICKYAFATVTASADDANLPSCTITTINTDREGDRVVPEGGDFTNFLKSPVLMWAHGGSERYGALPIGTVTSLDVQPGQGVKATWKWLEGDPFADRIRNAWDQGVVRASSIGFQSVQATPNGKGFDHERWELIELSLCAVPMNPEAVRTLKNLGLMDEPSLVLGPDGCWAEPSHEKVEHKRDDAIGTASYSTPSDRDYVDALSTDQVNAVLKVVCERSDLGLITKELFERLTEKRGRVLSAVNESRLRKVKDVPAEQDAPLRWNTSLSKSFDVASQEFPPQSKEQALAAKYIECRVKSLHHTEERVSSTRMGAFLAAMDEFLSDDAIAVDDVRNLDYRGEEAPPMFEDIQLNSKQTQNFLIDGMRFLSWNDARMTLRVEPRWFGLCVTCYVDRANKNAGSELIGRVKARAKELNFLKGEAFALSGEFLPRGDESLGDLFLDNKNAQSVKRLLTLINEKGAQLENRGALLVGPPGTGKTLSGRILMNHAKATFVWVSARDFAYGGGFRGLADAFEIARECAPTVLFVEDVDNWIDGHTVDLLKTEMDGIARSSGVLTVLTTNFPELLPKALIDRPGRFHDVLRFDLPNESARKAMLSKWMPGLDKSDMDRAVKATAGYSGAHVRELVRFASILAEQDQLTATASLTAALAKLQEQRDLITSVQTQGARYRAQDFVVAKSMAAIQKRGRVLSAVNESRLRAALTALSEANTVLGDVLAQIAPISDEPIDEEPVSETVALDTPPPVIALDAAEQHSLSRAEDEFDLGGGLRLLLVDPSEDHASVLTLVDDVAAEPTFTIDPALMRAVVSESIRQEMQSGLIGPIGESVQRALDRARGRVS